MQKNEKNNLSYHTPVFLEKILMFFNYFGKGIFVDGTLGGSGHSYAMLKTYKNIKLLGLDKDSDAIKYSTEKLKEFEDRIKLFNMGFENLNKALKIASVSKLDGVLLDLGVSSFQIDNKEKGFSFQKEGPLNMSFNNADNNAWLVINKYDENDLVRIFKEYGEEFRYAYKIAKAICIKRSEKFVSTTKELAGIIYGVAGRKIKTVAKIFQAIRIEVNSELNSLKKFLEFIPDHMNKNARLAVISYHSLEDRIVKRFFQEYTHFVDKGRFMFPGEKKIEPIFKKITKKPLRPDAKEIDRNSRSRSAKLRVIEKI